MNGSHKVDAAFPNGSALGVRRTTLHCVLVEQAAREGVEMVWRATVTGISAGAVQLNGNAVAARWIIGADGTASRVRNGSTSNPHGAILSGSPSAAIFV